MRDGRWDHRGRAERRPASAPLRVVLMLRGGDFWRFFLLELTGCGGRGKVVRKRREVEKLLCVMI